MSYDPASAAVVATDHELGAAFTSGGDDGLTRVYRRYGPLVHTVALRALGDQDEAADVTQQVFIAAWQGRDRYRPSSGGLAGWLVGITKHKIADSWAARHRDRKIVDSVVASAAEPASDLPLSNLLIDRVLLADELARLDEPQGVIMRLAFYDGLSHTEIADTLRLRWAR